MLAYTTTAEYNAAR